MTKLGEEEEEEEEEENAGTHLWTNKETGSLG